MSGRRSGDPLADRMIHQICTMLFNPKVMNHLLRAQHHMMMALRDIVLACLDRDRVDGTADDFTEIPLI